MAFPPPLDFLDQENQDDSEASHGKPTALILFGLSTVIQSGTSPSKEFAVNGTRALLKAIVCRAISNCFRDQFRSSSKLNCHRGGLSPGLDDMLSVIG